MDRDERLAVVLDEVLSRRTPGEPVDFDAIGAQHPDLVDEIRQLLVVGQMVDFVKSSPDPNRTTDHGPPRQGNLEKLPCSFGNYELVEEIGQGGMGIVYKAYDKPLQRFVALKMILRGQYATAADLDRFHAEAKAAAGLAHPNIVPVYQVGSHEGRAYFAMKYVAGRTLASVIAEGPRPQRQAAEYLLAIARGVQHAHENGILHRDLKPSNVLIDEDNQPLVTDFGLAKRVEGGASLTGTGAIVGTPSYMAPEQAEGFLQAATPACDVYSLGAIFYELLTGRPPFLAASPVETLLLVRTEEPVRPRALNPQIDLDLEFICRKCLEKRPEHRYARAADLAADLQAFLQGETVSARSSSLSYFFTRILRDTHHAPILENWGMLWMMHSAKILSLCALTSVLHGYFGIEAHWPYLAIWGVSLVVWGVFFLHLRRRGGPVTFVERQIAHAWASGVVASIGVFVVEWMLGLPVLILSPVLSVLAGMVFLVKAGTLSGTFYLAAAASFLGAVPMVWAGRTWGPLLFGVLSAASFFVPGLKYYRLRRDTLAAERSDQ